MENKPHILVVDDEKEILKIIRAYLEDFSYRVTTAESGEEAIQLLDKRNFNAVITDYRMQGTDGLDVLRYSKRKNPICEIIMITGYASLDSSLEALREKVFDFIGKPIELSQLQRSLDNALRKNSLQIENTRLVSVLNQQNEELEIKVEEATRELQDRAIKDYLTELHNYRFFVNALTTEISRSVRHNRALTLVMLDLDRFKSYNDDLGHLAGNEALKQVAKILQKLVRQNDIVARYGGEEFAIIFPETSKTEAAPIIERIQDALRKKKLMFKNAEDEEWLLTISAGIADFPNDADDFDSLIKEADQALFYAKRTGRDQLILACEKTKDLLKHEEN